jgi:NTP pyrophosphatase (non-canonical NTP hydrolase)
MTIKELCQKAHKNAVKKGFWATEKGILGNTNLLGNDEFGNPIYMQSCKDGYRNDGEMIALMHSELSEALEALRQTNTIKNNVGEELADCCIRIFDYCEGRNIDLEKEILNKMKINSKRPKLHGKKF